MEREAFYEAKMLRLTGSIVEKINYYLTSRKRGTQDDNRNYLEKKLINY